MGQPASKSPWHRPMKPGEEPCDLCDGFGYLLAIEGVELRAPAPGCMCGQCYDDEPVGAVPCLSCHGEGVRRPGP